MDRCLRRVGSGVRPIRCNCPRTVHQGQQSCCGASRGGHNSRGTGCYVFQDRPQPVGHHRRSSGNSGDAAPSKRGVAGPCRPHLGHAREQAGLLRCRRSHCFGSFRSLHYAGWHLNCGYLLPCGYRHQFQRCAASSSLNDPCYLGCCCFRCSRRRREAESGCGCVGWRRRLVRPHVPGPNIEPVGLDPGDKPVLAPTHGRHRQS